MCKKILFLTILLSHAILFCMKRKFIEEGKEYEATVIVQPERVPYFKSLPTEVRRIIQKMVINSIVTDDEQATQKNLQNFARISSDFRKALNEPETLIFLIEKLADVFWPYSENYIAKVWFKNMPGIKEKKIQDWLEHIKKERGVVGQLVESMYGYNLKNIQKRIAFIVQNNMNINRVDTFLGYAPLHHAILTPIPSEVVQELLNNGADVNAQTKSDKTTPLMLAVIEKDLEIIKLLLSKNPDLSLRDSDNNTVFDIAHYVENDDILKALEEYQKELMLQQKK